MSISNHLLAGLRDRRQALGIPASHFATRLGVTVTTYNRFERGERRAYLDQAHAIAKILNCTIEQLASPPSVDEQVELFRRSKTQREEQADREHRAAEEVQHDLADHGFVTSVTEENTPGTVVDAAHTQPAADTDGDDATRMLADWGFDEDDEQ